MEKEKEFYYCLEYSEKQQCFHYNNGSHEKESNGFATIHPYLNEKLCTPFCDAICTLYSEKMPTTERVKELFNFYSIIHDIPK